ncbi:MAG: hypothetical protein LQ342_002998 [Letrouitia transgressa]|nr:MAG: hypothetical protein LQ342_002998 [Letrouitia transgressa]
MASAEKSHNTPRGYRSQFAIASPSSSTSDPEQQLQNNLDYRLAVDRPINAFQASSNLQSGERYDVPDGFQNLDELAAPAPVTRPRHQRQGSNLEDHRSKEWEKLHEGRVEPYEMQRQGTNSEGDSDEYYTLPVSYANLDELGAPPPVEIVQADRQGGQLEDRLSVAEKTDLHGAAPSPSSAGATEEKTGSPSRHVRASRLATELYTVSYLILFSILGTLARLGLQALTFYPGAPVQTGVLWANVGGSLLMGFFSEDHKLFSNEQSFGAQETANPERADSSAQEALKKEHANFKKTIPLYIGLTTGFCGSFTSFSSFIRDAYLAMSNALHVPISHTSTAPIDPNSTVPRNCGYSFLALVAVIISTASLSLGALIAGAHLAIAMEPFTPSMLWLFARKIVDRSMVLIAWGCWVGTIIMSIWPPDRPGGPVGRGSWTRETWRSNALFALVFAPAGCLLRFYISIMLNRRIPSFPLGTFAANIFGTMMQGMFYDIEHVPLGGMVGCQVLQGLQDGFCGALTTVSTWVVELKGLKLRHGYVYGTVSVAVGLGVMTAGMGSLQWTRGFSTPKCMA